MKKIWINSKENPYANQTDECGCLNEGKWKARKASAGFWTQHGLKHFLQFWKIQFSGSVEQAFGFCSAPPPHHLCFGNWIVATVMRNGYLLHFFPNLFQILFLTALTSINSCYQLLDCLINKNNLVCSLESNDKVKRWICLLFSVFLFSGYILFDSSSPRMLLLMMEFLLGHKQLLVFMPHIHPWVS